MPLDIRPGDQFAAGHVPDSINIALSGQFATWAGTILGLSSNPVLIADSTEQLAEARLRLARVGIEAERGYLQGGVAGWSQAGFDLAQASRNYSVRVTQRLSENTINALDVRREGEWTAGHVAEQPGGRSIASGFRLPTSISISHWQCTARADIAA